ncbi:MAG TPA: hypothetical protein VF781_12590 [Solirubrobacteraceae bacterium]
MTARWVMAVILIAGPTTLAGCGGDAPGGPHSTAATRAASPGARVPAVTLLLHGGRNATLGACGAEHHFRAYSAGTIVRYTGVVSPIPSGRWKVKLKIKVCTKGRFTEVGKIEALRNKHTGAYGGRFQAPAAGTYEARALLYVNGAESAKSRKRHFLTR